MRPFRVSVAGLMAGILYLGAALAALTNPTGLWCEAWTTTALAVLAVAALGALYSGRRGTRVFWGGFAIVGGGYLALNLVPADPPRLVPGALLDRYFRTLSYHPTPSDVTCWVWMGQRFQEAQMNPPYPGDPAGVYRFTLHGAEPRGTVSGMSPPRPSAPSGPTSTSGSVSPSWPSRSPSPVASSRSASPHDATPRPPESGRARADPPGSGRETPAPRVTDPPHSKRIPL